MKQINSRTLFATHNIPAYNIVNTTIEYLPDRHMGKIEKTVFISYRRTNIGYALAIFQNLSQRGYDVFFDYDSIDSGDYEQIIYNNIESRAHFLVILTPSALERLHEPGDWLRREIEYAIDTKRNIIPVTMDNFDWKGAEKFLSGKLHVLANYNSITVPAEYFLEAMERLCSRHLNIAQDAVIHPATAMAQQASRRAKQNAEAQPDVQQDDLTAQEWYEKGVALSDGSLEEIRCYTEAITLKPDYIHAYNNRGVAYKENGQLLEAIHDYTLAIGLDTEYAEAFNNRGNARRISGDIERAILDCSMAIKLKPDYANAYFNRALCHADTADFEKAIADYSRTIEIDPDYCEVYYRRALAYIALEDKQSAIRDYQSTLACDSSHSSAYNNLAW